MGVFMIGTVRVEWFSELVVSRLDYQKERNV